MVMYIFLCYSLILPTLSFLLQLPHVCKSGEPKLKKKKGFPGFLLGLFYKVQLFSSLFSHHTLPSLVVLSVGSEPLASASLRYLTPRLSGPHPRPIGIKLWGWCSSKSASPQVTLTHAAAGEPLC